MTATRQVLDPLFTVCPCCKGKYLTAMFTLHNCACGRRHDIEMLSKGALAIGAGGGK